MYRAVVVDDEPLMLEGMRLMIDWAGCGFELCGEAASAQDALRLVETLRPHLLITDVKMPGMLGTDLAAIVRRYHPETALLFFSGYQDFAFAQSAIRSNAAGYLLKPIDSDEVHSALKRVQKELDERRIRGQRAGSQRSMLRGYVLRRIASGDVSASNLMRAGVLLNLKQSTPCYCAVFALDGPLPDHAALLLSMPGAVLFRLSPKECGLCVALMERDFELLGQRKRHLEQATRCGGMVCVGGVGRGAEGFALSLRQALDAQGALFESRGGARVYCACDGDTSAWLNEARLERLTELFFATESDGLEQWLQALAKNVERRKHSGFALRYLARSADTLLMLAYARERRFFPAESPLRYLWRDEPESNQAWLSAFAAALGEMRRQWFRELGEPVPAPVRDALGILQGRYREPLAIGEVAAELNLNPAYLGQLIRRHTGQTFHQLLLGIRVSHACKALRRTSQNVGEIAAAVGFRDVDYFSRQFRHCVGMSPNAYRAYGAKGDEEAP